MRGHVSDDSDDAWGRGGPQYHSSMTHDDCPTYLGTCYSCLFKYVAHSLSTFILTAAATISFPVNDGGSTMSAIGSSSVILTGGSGSSSKSFMLGGTDLYSNGWTDTSLGDLGLSWWDTSRPSWSYNSDYLVLSQPAPLGYGGSTIEGKSLLSMPGMTGVVSLTGMTGYCWIETWLPGSILIGYIKEVWAPP